MSGNVFVGSGKRPFRGHWMRSSARSCKRPRDMMRTYRISRDFFLRVIRISVYSGLREKEPGPLMEYMLNHAVLATLVELSIGDTPFGVKGAPRVPPPF